jgi:predicted CXXCH cytochrome family protein
MDRKLVGVLALLLAVGSSPGCVDERIVYQDRPVFEEPAPAAAGFLGYSNPTTKLTTCGNCHTGQQARWRQTAHAGAWKTLQDSPAKQALCEGCHSVNSRGNIMEGAQGGLLAVRQERYEDVQCESCHGPGLQHVLNPDARPNRPWAPLEVGIGMEKGCGQCHSGAHQPFVEEWARSGHGRVVASPAGRPECQGCHTGENALQEWGFRANYLEKEAALGSNTVHIPITCGVCHDPHDATIPGQLRFSITAPSQENNLCIKCHQKRGNPDPTTFRGPHSPQGPVLLGYAGNWFPPMQFPDTVTATHGSERNPRLCAGCHVNRFDVTDKLTGTFVARSVGHTFEATPCVDANGVPIAGPCADQQKTYRTCTDAGCHGSEAVARSLKDRSDQRIARLADELDLLLRRVTPNWQTCRRTGNCPGTEFHGADGRWTVAEGAAFNYELAFSGGSVVHNPVLIEVLLLSSIREVRRAYGLAAQTDVALERSIGIQ